MNLGPPGYGEGVTSSTSGFATLAIGRKFRYLNTDLAHIRAGSRIPVNGSANTTIRAHEIVAAQAANEPSGPASQGAKVHLCIKAIKTTRCGVICLQD